MNQSERIKVIYIAGWGRSGTTLLDNIFGQLEGFFSVGEIRFIWERNFIGNLSCGCGKKFSECETWVQIINDAFGSAENVDVEFLNKMMRDYTSTRRTPLFFLNRGRMLSHDASDPYRLALIKLYKSISRNTRSRVIIDSSKFPLYASVLKSIPDLDVYVVHILRDPRAVAYSWMHPKAVNNDLQGEEMERISPLISAGLWMVWNVTLSFMKYMTPKRYHLIKYEDFVRSPSSSIKEILAFAGESEHVLPFLSEFSVQMKSNHTLSGNPNRFNNGVVEIKQDIRWQSELSLFYKIFTVVLTWPLMVFYKFRL